MEYGEWELNKSERGGVEDMGGVKKKNSGEEIGRREFIERGY
jgi:hypothetical protein